MANITVLGGDGFIGRHLVARLAGLTDEMHNIRVFSRFSNYKSGDRHPFQELSNVTIIPGDFSNRNEVSSAIEKADYVFHLISTTNPATSSEEPLAEVDTNIRFTIELLESCVYHKVKKVIFLSSGGTVYGDVDSSTINEQTLPLPRSPYGIGKITIEHYLRYFKHTHGLDYIVYRVANPYGPGQNIYGKQGVIPIFMRSLLTNSTITVYGDGTMVRDYIYIDDLINMITTSYAKSSQSEVYNLGSGSGVTINQIISTIEKCTGGHLKKIYTETPSTFVHKSVLDIQRFTQEFGFKHPLSLEDGIKRTWDYVKEIK